MRPIDGDALIKKAYDEAKGMAEPYDNFGVLVDWLVSKSPTIEPERKKGEWVGAQSYCKHLEEKTGERYAPTGIGNLIYCNRCWQASNRRSDFCPDCGADMRKEGDTNC